MPIYEYVCSSCHHQLEAMQSIKDPPLKLCPACKRRTLKKVVSAAGFVLKGTGWYATDFRDKGGAKKDKEAGAEKQGQETKETKPAAEKPDKAPKSTGPKETTGKKPKGKAASH